MNATQALKQARKLFGKDAAVQRSRHESSQKMRDEARALIQSIKALPADERNAPEIKRRHREACAESVRYQYTVGRITGIPGFSMFAVLGRGDTFEHAFSNVKQEDKKAA